MTCPSRKDVLRIMKSQYGSQDINGSAFSVAREKKGLSQEELARELCLSSRHISELETNQCVVFFSYSHRHQVAKKVATYLGISEDEAFLKPLKTEVLASDNGRSMFDSTPKESNTPEKIAIKPNLRFSTASPEYERAEQSVLNENLSEKEIPQIGSKLNWHIKRISLASVALGVIFGVFYTSVDSFEYFAKPQSKDSLANPVQTESPQAPIDIDAQIDKPSKETIPNSTSGAIPTSSNSDTCSIKGGTPYPYSNPNPTKPSNYVFVIAKGKTTFCIVDAEGVLVNTTLESGTSKSFYGKPPFLVVPDNFAAVDIFFEGNKLWGLPLDIKALKLGTKI